MRVEVAVHSKVRGIVSQRIEFWEPGNPDVLSWALGYTLDRIRDNMLAAHKEEYYGT